MQPLQFNPFPEIKTGRLLLRQMRPSDAPEVFFLRSDADVMRYLDRDREQSVDTARAYIERINRNIDNNEAIVWGIALAGQPDILIGTICLWKFQEENSRCEIGYALHPGHWGKGIMKEAAVAVMDYGKQTLELHSMEGHINPGNTASAALLESLGFAREAYFRENYHYNGKYLDTVVFGIVLGKKGEKNKSKDGRLKTKD